MSAFAISTDLQDRDAVLGEKPDGAGGVTLGPFGSLRGASPEAVADTVVGRHVGDRAPESVAKARFRWVRGISALDRATLGASWLDFVSGTGLLRARVPEDGVRYAERARGDARVPRSMNLPPAPVETVPIAGPDPAADAAKRAELASLDARVRAIVRDELAARGIA